MYSVSEPFSVFWLSTFLRFRHNRRHEENKFWVSKGQGRGGRKNFVHRMELYRPSATSLPLGKLVG